MARRLKMAEVTVVHRCHAAHAPVADGNKIEVPLVVFVDEIVRAGIVIAGDLQDECPIEQAVNAGNLPWRFGRLEQVASLAGRVRE